jgi:hypothetical protein
LGEHGFFTSSPHYSLKRRLRVTTAAYTQRANLAQRANLMPFDDPSVPADSGRLLSIVPCREGWAIKHGNGFLGVSADREEALRLLQILQEAVTPQPILD